MSIKQFIKHNLEGKSLFISGGTGFIGKNILSYLYSNQIHLARITLLTRNANKFKTMHPELSCISNLEFLEQDILDLSYKDGEYDYIIHAATSVVDRVAPAQLFTEIITGTRNMLDFAVHSKTRSFINISSGAVYGEINQLQAVSEDYHWMPKIDSQTSSYGIGKLAAEHYSYLYANSNMKVTTLRCFCFGGAYLDMNHYVLGYIIRQAVNNEDIIIQAGNEIYRSYLATDDLVEAIFYTQIKASLRKSDYEVYNIGSDDAVSIPKLAQIVCQTLGSSSKIICPNIDNKQVSYYIPNVDKVRATGLSMQSKLQDIILNVQQYYKSLNK